MSECLNILDKYNIVRYYQTGGSAVVRSGLTLEEAQAWCKDPETSSSTCTSEEGKARTRERGPWFDGYTEQKPRHYSSGGGYDYHSRGAPTDEINNAFVRGQF